MGYRAFALAIAAGLAVAPALADEMGAIEYANSCAQCHGADGSGNGPVAQYLVDPAPPLTALRKDNGGVFPVRYVVEVLEGTVDIGVHGRDMPVWGPRYRKELTAGMEGSLGLSADEVETFAIVRTLSLIDYLASIQVE